MRWVIGVGLLPICFAAMVAVLRRSVGGMMRLARFDRARDQFRLRREWLEARFLDGLAQLDPSERLRWEEANWHNEVTWARDRQTGRFGPLLPPEEAPRPYSDAEESYRREVRAKAMVGTRAQVGERLRALAAELEIEELVVITWTWDPAAQRRSYELLAQEFGLQGA